MRKKSRLNKTTEKKQKKTILLSIIGIIVILIVLFKFGISAIINFSLFLSGNNNLSNPLEKNQISYIPPPVLNPLPQATNSAQIIISGSSQKNLIIDLFINDKQIDQVDTDDKGGFSFAEDLIKGDNFIQAKAQYRNKKSNFSNTFSVTYSDREPKLDVSSPNDGQSFNKDQNKANISGQTDPGVTVTVNGFWAVTDENNNFSYLLPLQNGDNQIKIIAIDQAGNKAEKNLKINYSQ